MDGLLQRVFWAKPLALPALVCLLLDAAGMLRAGDAPGAATTNGVAATNAPAGGSTASALPFWVDAPSNAARSDLFGCSGLAATHFP